ncbi:hypothetical protein [Geobacter pickeringii]|uniref:Uncharacterized protein n=1 Tax=Geobacter pickeringii TaxID=345632 RepID=A0A0B5BC00_9BACT|nr:hypothetical protein [Geobacter pickeringii]AJE02080.1 hypothetical protein GPICK_00630 [Geobacter pickeringii]
MGRITEAAFIALVATLPLAGGTARAAGGTVGADQLADGAVTYRAIAPNAVTNSKIVDGAVNDAKLGFGAVTSPKLADGAVSDAKITGPISGFKIGRHGHDGADIVTGTIDAARLPVGTGPGTVAAGDHTHEGLLKKPANLVIVAPSGGDFTSPLDALNAITDASADKPYLVKIMPGSYDLGLATLVMKEYVDLEGAGELTTLLRGSAADAGVVAGASHAELRNLAVEASGSEGNIVGIFSGSASPRLTHVTVRAEGGKNAYGIYNLMASPVISDVTVTTGGSGATFGIFNLHSSPMVKNSAVTAGTGVSSFYSGTATVEGSSVAGSLITIYTGTGTTTRVANTRLEGGAPATSGIVKCVGVYDGSFEPVTCR